MLFSVFVFIPQPWWIRGQASSSSTTRVIYERINRCVEFSGNIKSSSRNKNWLSFLLSKINIFGKKVPASVPDICKLWCDHTVVKITISPLFRLFMVIFYSCSDEIHTVEFSPFSNLPSLCALIQVQIRRKMFFFNVLGLCF